MEGSQSKVIQTLSKNPKNFNAAQTQLQGQSCTTEVSKNHSFTQEWSETITQKQLPPW